MKSLSVKYRPENFDSVKCQESVIQILRRQLELEQFNNVYLFCGPSGCGKTTIARIFASAINKGKGLPIELDAASNNGVDNIRLIINSASERSLDAEYKVYIIDECHMLTIQAWNALLKTIEEPPKYTIFIFCTTDIQKVPDTIKNRCMRFNLTRIPYREIKSRLMFISEQEGYINYEPVCDYIAKMSNGQMRDAIASLEKIAAFSTQIDIEEALKILNDISYLKMFDLINLIIDGKEEDILYAVNTFFMSGYDMRIFIDQFLEFCLDLSKYCICKDIDITHIPKVYEEHTRAATEFENNKSYYSYIVDKLFELKNQLKNDLNSKTTIDIYMLRMARCQ